MDVILQTNDVDKRLGLYAVERYADDSGYCAELRIASHGFAAELQFCFEPARLAEFIDQVEHMNRTLAGEAVLRPTYEPSYIKLAVMRTGAVVVSGELQTLIDGEDHALRYGFRTDQTCLAPLIRDLRACTTLAAA